MSFGRRRRPRRVNRISRRRNVSGQVGTGGFTIRNNTAHSTIKQVQQMGKAIPVSWIFDAYDVPRECFQKIASVLEKYPEENVEIMWKNPEDTGNLILGTWVF